jgi:quinol monooxygenase YgiN
MPHLSDQCCSVLELRQYTLHPGHREALLDVFEGSLVEPQEEVGMHVVATFTDLDRADRFVWIRGFADNDSRSTALRAFYTGEVWRANREAVNETIIDSDDVLLLQPAAGLPETSDVRPADRDAPLSARVISATIYSLEPGADDSAALAAVDESALGVLHTHPGPNGFPGLPVREGEQVVVVLTDGDQPGADLPGATITQRLRLSPTSRSELR